MSKITTTKKIVMEDLPEQHRPWLVKLVEPLNRFLEQAYAALVGGLTLGDNLKAQVSTITLTATTTTTQSVMWTKNEKPTAVFIGQIADEAGTAVPNYVFTWTYADNALHLTFTGLTAAHKYSIKIIGLV